MIADTAKKRKRVKLTEGEVFELALPDGRFGYGMVVKQGKLKNGGTPFVAVFGSAHSERPDLAKIVSDPVALAGWTMDALVYHGRWNVIGRSLTRPPIPFPNFKVGMEGKVYATDVDGNLIDEATPEERELLDFRWTRAPIAFQNAFEALHGFGDRQEHYDQFTPDYSRARITRPA